MTYYAAKMGSRIINSICGWSAFISCYSSMSNLLGILSPFPLSLIVSGDV